MKRFLTLFWAFCTLSLFAQEAKLVEKPVFSTDFSDWTEFTAKDKNHASTTQTFQTAYSHEELTFTIVNTSVLPAGTETKITHANASVGMLKAQKQSDAAENAYVETSVLKSVTKVYYLHGATGSERGWGLQVKGENDTEWTTVYSTVAKQTGTEVTVDINRENVQLRFYNLSLSNYAMMTDLTIFGNVDMSNKPILATIEFNGLKYNVADIFQENDDTTFVATVKMSKKLPALSIQNPLTAVAEAGETGTITYAATSEADPEKFSEIINIPVTLDGKTITYVLTLLYKPDCIITYVSGSETIGTQRVEEGDSIGSFAYSAADVVVPTGYAFRGWLRNPKTGQKARITNQVTEHITLTALITPIETASTTARYDYAINNIYFYIDDHEAIEVKGGEWHDATHGYVFTAGDSLRLLVGGEAYLSLGRCNYSSGSAYIIMGDKNMPSKVSSDGQVGTFHYTGPEGWVSIGFDGTTYIHSVAIINVADAPQMQDSATGYYMVEKGNTQSLLNAIDIACGTSSAASPSRIFVPDGLYDLGQKTLTCMQGTNVSLIGESEAGTIIRNAPLVENEGIATTATLLITGKNTYLQDLTLRNDLDYYHAVGGSARAVAMQDKGTYTICKNVRLLSYQDTYYSNLDGQKCYFEGGVIQGTVDFLCGGGSVFLNNVLLQVMKRKLDGSGECCITASNAKLPELGYCFSNCKIASEQTLVSLGRTWNDAPQVVYINTQLLNNFNLNASGKIQRWTLLGMNNTLPYLFGEYATTNTEGEIVSPASNIVPFSDGKGNTTNIETILTPEQAAEFTLERFFPDWTPNLDAAQVQVTNVRKEGSQLRWDAPKTDYTPAFLIYVDSALVAITADTEYTLPAGAVTNGVRMSNARGGFGPKVGTDAPIAGIESPSLHPTAIKKYNVLGQPVDDSFQGLVVSQKGKTWQF